MITQLCSFALVYELEIYLNKFIFSQKKVCPSARIECLDGDVRLERGSARMPECLTLFFPRKEDIKLLGHSCKVGNASFLG